MLTSSGTCGTILTCNSFPYFAESGGVAVTSFLSVTSCNARRDIVVGAENPRTGKTVAEKACGHCLQPSALFASWCACCVHACWCAKVSPSLDC